MSDDSYLFGFTGVWHVRHADGTTEDIELTHGNLVEDTRRTRGQFILHPPDMPPACLLPAEEPTAEELAKFERRLAEAVKDSDWRVIQTPAPPITRESLKAALALYFDVDADDPETDGGERELASARRALEKIKELADEQ